MAWGSNTNSVAIGDPTKKSHYDDLWDKLQYVRSDVIPAASIMLFGQVTVQGWTRKSDWQDDSALIYSASGALGSGGSAAASVHNHQWYESAGGSTAQHDVSGGVARSWNAAGAAINFAGATDLFTGPSRAYYQEVAAFTKDAYT